MFLGITEGAWKWLLGAVPIIIGWGWWCALKIRAMATRDDIKNLATKVDTDAVCSLMESSEKAIMALQVSIDEGTRIQGQIRVLMVRQLEGVPFTAEDVISGRGDNGGGD
jgi:hypothetical protein